MDWESYFAELEGQFADDAAAEQAAVAQENERLRQARLDLLTRLRSAAAEHATIAIATAGPHQISGTIQATGADWCGIDTATSAMRCVRLDAMRSIRLSSLALRRSLMTVPPDALQGRATFGYVLRGWASKRTPVLIQFTDGTVASGTIDRAGNDHCDFALHDAHTSRRDDHVTHVLMVPFAAIVAAGPIVARV